MDVTESVAVMAPFLMVVAIVAIVNFSKVYRDRLRVEGRRRPEDEAMMASMQGQIDKLSARMAVLEKLVTDDDRRLAGEIERLRDRPGANY